MCLFFLQRNGQTFDNRYMYCGNVVRHVYTSISMDGDLTLTHLAIPRPADLRPHGVCLSIIFYQCSVFFVAFLEL